MTSKEVTAVPDDIRELLVAAAVHVAGDTSAFVITDSGIRVANYYGFGRDEYVASFYTWDELRQRRDLLQARLAKGHINSTVYHPVRTLDAKGEPLGWCGEGWKHENYRTLPIDRFESEGRSVCQNCVKYAKKLRMPHLQPTLTMTERNVI